MKTLYEIGGDLAALEALLEEVGGDVTDEQAEAAIEAWLEELHSDRDVKIDNYCGLIRNFEAMAEARKAEAKRMRDMATADENRAERLKSRLKEFFESRGLGKVATPRFTVAVQKNGGKAPLWIAPDYEESPELLPDHLQKITISPDRDKIREECHALNGVWDENVLVAEIRESGTHLRIR